MTEKKVYVTYGLEDLPPDFIRCHPDSVADFNSDVCEFVLAGVIDKVKDLKTFFECVHNALIPGGKVAVHSPYFRSPLAWITPGTVRGISEYSLSWLSKQWRELNKFNEFEVPYDFDVQYGFVMNPELDTRSQDARNFALLNFAGSISTVQFTLTKK